MSVPEYLDPILSLGTVTSQRQTEFSDSTGILSAGEQEDEEDDEDAEAVNEAEAEELEEEEEDEEGILLSGDLGSTMTRQDPSPHTTARIPRKF